MIETIEDVKRRNKRLLCVLAHQGWTEGLAGGWVLSFETPHAILLLLPLGVPGFKKPYWLKTTGRACTYKHEAAVLKRLGVKP